MDEFKEKYNSVRPHEVLNMKTPNSQHVRSTREFSEKQRKYDYDFHSKKLKVTINGVTRWGAYH